MQTVKCKAATAFNRHVPEYGFVVGDPDSSLEEARSPMVPEHLVEAWTDEGILATDKAPAAKSAAAEKAPS